MVINVGALKSGDLRLVERDIEAVTAPCREFGAVSKVIIEAALLTDDEKVTACTLAKAAAADFVKTSTGLRPWRRDSGRRRVDAPSGRRRDGREGRGRRPRPRRAEGDGGGRRDAHRRQRRRAHRAGVPRAEAGARPGKDIDVRYLTALVAACVLVLSGPPAKVALVRGSVLSRRRRCWRPPERSVRSSSAAIPSTDAWTPRPAWPTGPVPDLVRGTGADAEGASTMLPAPDAAGRDRRAQERRGRHRVSRLRRDSRARSGLRCRPSS